MKSSKQTIKEGQWIHTSHYFNQYTSNKSKRYNHLPKSRNVSFVSSPISVGMLVNSLVSVKSSKQTIKEGQWIHTSHYFNQYTSNKSKRYNHLLKSRDSRFVSCPISAGMVVPPNLFLPVKSSKHTIKEGQWIHTSHYFNQYTCNTSKQYKHLPK